MRLLLLQVKMTVEEMPSSDRDSHITMKRAFSHSATMQPFDLNTVSGQMQHLADVDISLLGSTMVQVTEISLLASLPFFLLVLPPRAPHPLPSNPPHMV